MSVKTNRKLHYISYVILPLNRHFNKTSYKSISSKILYDYKNDYYDIMSISNITY